MPYIRLGIGPIGWANDDLRGWGPDITGDQIMAEMAATGYSGSEMSYLYPQTPEALEDALNEHRLVLAAAYHWTNLTHEGRLDGELRRAREHVDFCADAGAKFALFAEGGGSLHWDADGPRSTIRPFNDAAWARLASALNELGAHARDRGITACVHPHAGTALERQPEVERLLSLTSPSLVHWCLDTGHAALAETDTLGMIRAHANRIRYVHLKDVRADVAQRVRAEKPAFTEAIRWNVFGAPGQGSLDFNAIIGALLENDYEGWLIVEADQDPNTHPAFDVARNARAFLEQILEKHMVTLP
ncbi:MAG: myo-inosose-2 dehydratase [Proteobacteria bacterium]|nr:myo-inosose-2 dehydratase [Pseudomonadota bacterium]